MSATPTPDPIQHNRPATGPRTPKDSAEHTDDDTATDTARDDHRDGDPLSRSCAGCLAEPGEECHPDCLSCTQERREPDVLTPPRREPPTLHYRAARHPGALCGGDTRPRSRVTTDPALVTCPDCDPVTAQIDALPDDTLPGGAQPTGESTGDPAVIGMLREVASGAWRKIDGVVVDATTAHAILTVYDALNPANKARLAALRIDRMASLAWKVLRPSGGA